MEIRKRGNASPGAPSHRAAAIPLFQFLLSVFLILSLGACGAPSPPHAPRPPVPGAVTDLAARQVGDKVQLTFTLPKETTDAVPLEEPPQLEIYRGFLSASAVPGQTAAKTTLMFTVPSAVVDTYLVEGRVQFNDPLTPQDWTLHAGEQRVYAVKTRASKHRNSEFSNVVAVRVFPVPQPIQVVAATVTEPAIELKWLPPARTTSGAPLTESGASIAGYRVYRAMASADAKAPATPPEFLAITPAPSFRDTQFEFGRVYVYSVTSVAQYAADSVESEFSPPVTVVARDIFPPAAPQNLVVVLVPASESAPAQMELSWAISQEPDLSGYYVYRSEQEGTPGQKITPQLLQVPTFRDTNVLPGRRYIYTVTAVDKTGNESPRSAPVSENVPEAKQHL